MLSATSASLLVSALSYILLYPAASILPLFDKSPLLTPRAPLLYPLLRWDSFHFIHIARYGYVYEHEWAFFPGTPVLIRYLPPTNIPFILVLAAVACDSSRTLYLLSLHHLQSRSLAYMTLIISLLSFSPVTVRLVPYSEPFFTYLSYKGEAHLLHVLFVFLYEN
jgi:phosphatidylinositol glycan class V